jgi:hypothetical protein
MILFPLVPRRKDGYSSRIFDLRLVHRQHNNPELLRINSSDYRVKRPPCSGMISACCCCMEWLDYVR